MGHTVDRKDTLTSHSLEITISLLRISSNQNEIFCTLAKEKFIGKYNPILAVHAYVYRLSEEER
jgi:hypothetical protein